MLNEGTEDTNISTHVPAPAIVSVAKSNANIKSENNTILDPDDECNENIGTASTDPASASTRRGLRTRRPAQQRPYYHDAQLFDDVEPAARGEEDFVHALPDSRRVSIASFGKSYDEDLLEQLDEEAVALLQEGMEPNPLERRPKHFKGKGRAWKKEESDEDEEFTIAKKKAAKAAKAAAKAKAKAKGQVNGQKKRGRPRKSMLSEDIVRDESDSDVDKMDGVSRNASQAGPKQTRGKPRKSVLSEEVVHDDSDSVAEEELGDEAMTDAPAAGVLSPRPNKRRRPRNNDQSMAATPTSRYNEDEEESLSNKSDTPKETPKSCTPKELPPQSTDSRPLWQEQDAKKEDNANEDLTLGSADADSMVSVARMKSASGDTQDENCKYPGREE